MMTKLTLSADENLVKDAKRLARRNRTSISSMFSRFILTAREAESKQVTAIAPITLKASGIAVLKKGRSDKELLEDALAEKYGA